ncbi:ribosome small subunit-dependent GTPase A [Natronosporangium hydrolyticum]|uniref:Small ribosomal subunit biogenesis GTPase RsgA n=1 Tax=Natronosporangium hydrolyticum TaxID=2811111 RepID=A0A895YF29_9ACTN|nr:ribosome small subunit-dependent GTPase A [Natronosporangium hydrolyticum]QSB16417.1 ribosome small subunit-dependent GTPase A [Natronosporangium hydrolyticum]
MTYDLTSLGWDATFTDEYAARVSADSDHYPGRVLRADRGVCTVLTASGIVRASVAGAVLSAAGGDPTVLPGAGDWVVVREWPDERITAEAVLPRRTSLIRRTAGKDASGQLLAANLDTVAVVEAIDPSPDLARVERLLALAWESGAEPVVVLTKADLAADAPTVADQVADATAGVPVLPVSAERGDGLPALRPYLGVGRTLGLVGPSGCGKSSLVNALAGAAVMGTQSVRRVDGKGRHTTTYRELVPLPGGGAVLDTPGVRAVGLLDGSGGLDRAFAEVVALTEQCRFGDCGHASEPGCAVRAALASGELSPRRWESWLRLHREVAYESGRRRARSRVRSSGRR